MKEATENRSTVQEVKRLFKSGVISYDAAKTMLAPTVDRINQKGKQVAKKHKKTYNPISFSQLMR